MAGRRVYRQSIGPTLPAGHGLITDAVGRTHFGEGVSYANVGGNINIVVDFGPALKKIETTLAKYSDEIKRIALYNAINHEAAKLKTVIQRDIARSAGVSYARAGQTLTFMRANPGHLQAVIMSTDKAMKLSDFGTPGVGGVAGRNPRVKAWGKSKTYHGAFTIKLGGRWEIVKREEARSGAQRRNQNGSGKIKVLYGPILPREMIRPGNPSTQHLLAFMPQQLIPRTLHELSQAAARAGIK